MDYMHALASNTAGASATGRSSVAHVIETCLHICTSTTALSVFILLNDTIYVFLLYTPVQSFTYSSSFFSD